MTALRDFAINHPIAYGFGSSVLFVAVAVLVVPLLRRDAVKAARFLARAWVGNVAFSRNRRRQARMTRTVGQRAASEYLSQTREVWLREVAEQYRMEADR